MKEEYEICHCVNCGVTVLIPTTYGGESYGESAPVKCCPFPLIGTAYTNIVCEGKLKSVGIPWRIELAGMKQPTKCRSESNE